jgi:fanconi-associated nuclease 1
VHRLSKLQFESELGPYIPDAIDELCRKECAEVKCEIKTDEPEIIDLTSEDDDPPDEALPPREPDLTFFAEDESQMSLSELLACLTVGEISAVAKEMKLKVPQPVRLSS